MLHFLGSCKDLVGLTALNTGKIKICTTEIMRLAKVE